MGPRATALPDRLHGDLPLRGSWRSLKALGIRKLQKDINWESDADRLVGSHYAYLRDHYCLWAFSMGRLYKISVDVPVIIIFTEKKFRTKQKHLKEVMIFVNTELLELVIDCGSGSVSLNSFWIELFGKMPRCYLVVSYIGMPPSIKYLSRSHCMPSPRGRQRKKEIRPGLCFPWVYRLVQDSDMHHNSMCINQHICKQLWE